MNANPRNTIVQKNPIKLIGPQITFTTPFFFFLLFPFHNMNSKTTLVFNSYRFLYLYTLIIGIFT
ncbi:hypothetical protein HMPREF0083_05391 [Aneurinibacillus aneurinilyticus ATCC 12856]|uniref:Uncharacterized protein n=1 Tax=Aneurinibacillus aneurinilyticus ATCC 12856 TaxID=649747 RepID=U1WTZ5_ANEAE|nr:hypothetical protein HMPREF0083_05391 [Aneurinibacillus aneurinilyticus ATCC 12856]